VSEAGVSLATARGTGTGTGEIETVSTVTDILTGVIARVLAHQNMIRTPPNVDKLSRIGRHVTGTKKAQDYRLRSADPAMMTVLVEAAVTTTDASVASVKQSVSDHMSAELILANETSVS
jgi:RNase H-fold protein (predicted Holliday junction resolvase)